MILDEGKDLVDDKIKENKEEAEKWAEKEADGSHIKLQEDIRNVVAKQKMLEEDVKGLGVDHQI
ncbi:hypothetical protein [Clostridium sp. Marseille-P299]|uniref:hypothetical protein n=1 Tax=Clostridium sp. Marseille-P299 TaxID=1805477 RepID=UPI0011DE0179|nr:hypothetical protein [Clostridium sp. Marseille-P299]